MPKNRKRNREGFFESSNSKESFAQEKPTEMKTSDRLTPPFSLSYELIPIGRGPNCKKLTGTMPSGFVSEALAMPERKYTRKYQGSEPFAVDLESIRPKK